MTLASETPSLTQVSLSALWSRQDALVGARVRVPGLSLRTRTRAPSSRLTSAIQRAENTPQPAGSEDCAIGREILGSGNVLENGGATQSKKPISGPSVSQRLDLRLSGRYPELATESRPRERDPTQPALPAGSRALWGGLPGLAPKAQRIELTPF